MDSIPTFSHDLLEQLDKAYPRPLYKATDNMDEFLLRTGERRLIETLLRKFEAQEKETIPNVFKT
jgi:hypothetical protein